MTHGVVGSPEVTICRDDGTVAYVVTGYEDARRVLGGAQFSRGATGLSIECLDPPHHAAVRDLLGESFSSERVAQLRPTIAAAAAARVRALAGHSARGELIADFCVPFTFAVQCEALGVPEHHRAQLARLSAARSPDRPGAPPERGREAAHAALGAAVAEVLADLSGGDCAQLFPRLVAASRAGAIDPTTLVVHASSMLRDGPFLAAQQLANALLHLFEHPEALAAVRACPDRLEATLEELIRICPAINHSMTRVALTEMHLDGLTVPAGATVAVRIPAVNRDGRAFRYPADVCPERPSRHLSFGYGIHYCLGAHLARAELQVAIATLLSELPALRLALPSDRLGSFVSYGAAGVLELPVVW